MFTASQMHACCLNPSYRCHRTAGDHAASPEQLTVQNEPRHPAVLQTCTLSSCLVWQICRLRLSCSSQPWGCPGCSQRAGNHGRDAHPYGGRCENPCWKSPCELLAACLTSRLHHLRGVACVLAQQMASHVLAAPHIASAHDPCSAQHRVSCTWSKSKLTVHAAHSCTRHSSCVCFAVYT